MKGSRFVWTLVLLLLSGVCLGVPPVPVVAIVSDPALRDEAALLSAALGNESAMKLVEREQMDKILGEQKLAATGLTRAQSVSLGKLLKANGLFLLQRIEVSGKARISLRLVAVDPGVVVSDEQYSTELMSEDGIVTVLLPRLKPLWPKLAVSPDAAIPISVAGIHAPVDTVAFKELERELTLLLIHRLTREPELFVLERRNMEVLTAEKNLPSSDNVSEFLTGRCLAEGSFVENEKRLAVTLRLQFPGANETREVRAEGPRDDRPALLDSLAKQVLAALRKTPAAPAWSAAAEAKAYQNQAAWAFDHQLFPEAQSASETSWALGARGDVLSELRLKAYCLAAYPYWSTYHVGDNHNPYYPNSLDVRKEPRRLESAIRAMEILLDYLETQPRTEQPYTRYGASPGNHDYRILSGRAMLSASRVLRTFYEDEACLGHEDRLAELRRLLRENAAILIRDGGTADERGLWIYQLQSAYAPYWYERPEEVLEVYRSLLRKNIVGWLISRDYVSSDNRSVHPRQIKNQRTPWLLAWHSEDAKRIPQVWQAFLDGLQQSRKAEDQAASWMFRWYSEGRDFSFEPIRSFIWKHRAEIAPKNGSHFVWWELCQEFSNTVTPHRESCVRLYDYLMREGSMVEPRLIDNLVEVIIQSEDDQAWLWSLWKEYEARMNREQPKARMKLYTQIVNAYMGFRFKPSHAAWKRYGHQDNTPKKPQDYPPPPAGALPVTRFWTPWTRLEAPFHTVEMRELAYGDGKVWFAAGSHMYGKIFGIDLATFKTETIDAPQLKESFWRISLAASRQHLFLATGEGAQQYDLATGKWKVLAVPPGRYGVQFIEPYCYLLFDQSAFADPQHARSSPQGSGVYRIDPRTDKIELLTSTRRRPQVSALDSSPVYMPRAISQSATGSLYLSIELDDRSRRAIYKSDPAGLGWEQVFETGLKSRMIMHKDPGGLLVEVHNRWVGCRPYYKYFPDIGEKGRMAKLSDSTNDEAILTPSFAWKLPRNVGQAKNSAAIADAAWREGSLWLLTTRFAQIYQRSMSVNPSLHRYTQGQFDPLEIPLDLQISEEEQRAVIERARGTAGNKEVDQTFQLMTIPKLKDIDSMLLVPEGVMLYSIRGSGFWFLPTSDLNKYIEAKPATVGDGDSGY